MLPRWVTWSVALAALLAMLPLACVARARYAHTSKPRIHIIQDMDNQPRFKAQQANPLFADGRAMRRAVEGTIARGTLRDDEHLYAGLVRGEWAAAPPMPVDAALLERGRERFEIFCAPCHGLDGYGKGMVSRRADRLQEGTWVPPLSFHDAAVRARPDGHLFNTITHGIRTMPAYGRQVPAADRWAIVSYLRALQKSQAAPLADVPSERRSELR